MSTDSPLRGMLAMLVAVAAFALMDSGLKWLSPHYPPLQLAALRGLASLPLVLVWALLAVGPMALIRIRWPLHLLRGALAVLMMACFIHGLRTLPLSTTYSVFYVAPLLITALSVPLLGERVGPRRWSAIVCGFAGVLVIVRPTGEGMLSLGAVAILVSAVAYAISSIAVRVIGRTDSTHSMVVWMLTMLSAGALALSWHAWQPIGDGHWPIIAGIGVVGTLGQYAVTEAFRHAEASLVAPLEYTALAWAFGLDLLLWQILPDATTLLGASIIVLSGLYLLRRERVHVEAEHP